METQISIMMRCEDCGHIQEVKGFMTEDGSRYFGSAYYWCNMCGDGLPIPIKDENEREN